MKKISRAAGLIMMVFGLPFAAIGIFVLSLGYRAWRQSERAQHWEPTPIVLLDVRLDSTAGKDAQSRTYEAKARYTYTVDDITYENDRVSFHSGADNIGNWQREKYELLKAALDADGAFKAYVNPANPAESVLFPEPRLSMLLFHGGLGGIFALVGVGIVVGGALSFFGAGPLRKLQRQFPSEPWRWREDWAAGVIQSDSRKRARSTLGMAILWLMVSTIAFVAMLFGGSHPPFAAKLIVVLFECIGIALLIWAVREMRVAKRYGAAQFHLTSTPGVIGGKLAGVVALPEYAEPYDAYRVELLCERIVRSGKNSRRETVWNAELLLDPKKLPSRRDGVQLPVLFSIPYGLPPSEHPVYWTLRVRAKQPGIDVDVPFSVPVFVTAESRPDFAADDAGIRPYLLEPRVT